MNYQLYTQLQGCNLSRIIGKTVTHKVIEKINGKREIKSAGYERHKGESNLFHGTYQQCIWYIKNH